MNPGKVLDICGSPFSGVEALGAVMPMARMAPFSIMLVNDGMVPKIACTCPAARSVMAWAAPL